MAFGWGDSYTVARAMAVQLPSQRRFAQQSSNFSRLGTPRVVGQVSKSVSGIAAGSCPLQTTGWKPVLRSGRAKKRQVGNFSYDRTIRKSLPGGAGRPMQALGDT